MTFRSSTIAGLITATMLAAPLALAPAAFAQTPAPDHSQHHPDGQQTTPGMSPGDRGGMMMMPMMSQMMAGHNAMGDFPSLMRERTDGFLALVKTELKITDAQTAPWNGFADALRTAMSKLRDGAPKPSMMGSSMMGSSNWPERLAAHEKALAAQLDAIRTVQAPASALYAALTAEQKKTADALLSGGMAMRM
ncbi:MAG: Spy/CpxP family protein refolding chaperone [Reyranellales bacterium]